MAVAFEKSELVAHKCCEAVIDSIVRLSYTFLTIKRVSPDLITCDSLNQIFRQSGADESILDPSSEITTTKEEFDFEPYKYGLLSVASVLGQLPPTYPSPNTNNTNLVSRLMSASTPSLYY